MSEAGPGPEAPKTDAQREAEELVRLVDPSTLKELVAGINTVKRWGNGEVGIVFKCGRPVFVRFEITKSVTDRQQAASNL